MLRPATLESEPAGRTRPESADAGPAQPRWRGIVSRALSAPRLRRGWSDVAYAALVLTAGVLGLLLRLRLSQQPFVDPDF